LRNEKAVRETARFFLYSFSKEVSQIYGESRKGENNPDEMHHGRGNHQKRRPFWQAATVVGHWSGAGD
tara:strand:- start:3953 stop:4156 length:204 start_codon:yes stop_codon:yes gene_type:complete